MRTQRKLDRGVGLLPPKEQTVDEEFWLDHTMHGTFELYGSNDDIEDGFRWSYEARFTKGDLDAIVFLGERGGNDANAPESDDAVIVRY